MRRLIPLLLILLLVATCAHAEKTITLTFTGDVTLGGQDYGRGKEGTFDHYADTKGHAYFFEHLKDFFAEDDLTIVNFEGTLHDSTGGKQKGKTYCFRAPTDFVDILTLGNIEVASLANNHTYDYNKAGYTSTVETLTAANVGYFGSKDVYFFEKDGVKIALLSVNTSAFKGLKPWYDKEIVRLKEEEGCAAVLFCVHAGQEYDKHRHPVQEYYGRSLINAGADLIIMHHPHVVQGMEIHKDRSILYSIGNLCFGGNQKVREWETVIARVTLTFSDEGVYQGQQITLYPAVISGTDEYNDFQPRLVTGDTAHEVIRLMQIDSEMTILPFSEEDGFARQAYVPAVSEAPAE